ncbi:MAG UNVERIFIED_CONTAM: hypothetical protein MIL04_03045 [Klebsiella aerogenes]
MIVELIAVFMVDVLIPGYAPTDDGFHNDDMFGSSLMLSTGKLLVPSAVYSEASGIRIRMFKFSLADFPFPFIAEGARLSFAMAHPAIFCRLPNPFSSSP